MSWLLPDPPPIVVVRDWERTFEQWLAKLGWLVPLSLDVIGADATFDAFQDGISAADYAAVLRGLAPCPPKKPKPAQAECRRCEKLFCYFQLGTARRRYCGPCVELERVELLEFTKTQRRKRAIARAHEDRTIRPLLRFGGRLRALT